MTNIIPQGPFTAAEVPAFLDKAEYVVVATFRVKESQLERFKEEAKINVAASRLEPGSLDYRSYQDPEDPTLFVNIEYFTNKDAYGDHAATPHIQRLLPMLDDLLDGPIDIQFLVNY